jgi:hypothetical protein
MTTPLRVTLLRWSRGRRPASLLGDTRLLSPAPRRAPMATWRPRHTSSGPGRVSITGLDSGQPRRAGVSVDTKRNVRHEVVASVLADRRSCLIAPGPWSMVGLPLSALGGHSNAKLEGRRRTPVGGSPTTPAKIALDLLFGASEFEYRDLVGARITCEVHMCASPTKRVSKGDRTVLAVCGRGGA